MSSSRPVPSKTENCSSVFLHLSMNTERMDIDLWQLKRTTDFEKWNGIEWLGIQSSLSLVSYRNMPCLIALLQLTRPDWWSRGTRLNRGCKSLCFHGMHEFEGVDSWTHHALTPRHRVRKWLWNGLTNTNPRKVSRRNWSKTQETNPRKKVFSLFKNLSIQNRFKRTWAKTCGWFKISRLSSCQLQQEICYNQNIEASHWYASHACQHSNFFLQMWHSKQIWTNLLLPNFEQQQICLLTCNIPPRVSSCHLWVSCSDLWLRNL